MVPDERRATYLNRKGFTSINCMAVVGPDRQFFSVALHCTGRVHDARVYTCPNVGPREQVPAETLVGLQNLLVHL
ncbi:hypothetical protein FJT64_010596 [Amphibalanus amphitrite]|uniref:DDE Tnp4 domain-containing protein n=1 Tax=Amphibalanus amphitrite TaxID=1232801 RepID=A0A6A4VC37_AMPAM|nr:hypothetical protein FJT64_010596 [Amphibalanus amphitrite]